MERPKYIYGDENDPDFFDTEFGNAILGFGCGIGMIAFLCMIFICILRSIGG